MRFPALVIVALVVVCSLAATNTTDFWRQQLNLTASDMPFQCFSGHSHYIQDIKISIGTEKTARCIIICTVPWDQISISRPPKYL